MKRAQTRKFSNLIKSRRPPGEALSEDGRGLLQEAVFQLISHHQDTDHLITECVGQHPVSRPSRTADSHENALVEDVTSCSASVFSLVQQIREKSLLLASPVDTVAANFCASKLLLAIDGVQQTESAYVQDFYLLILKTIQTLVAQSCFNVKLFIDLICQQSCLPLSVLWQLHTYLVVSLDGYLKRRMGDEGFVSQLCDQLMEGCAVGGHGHCGAALIEKESLQGVLQCLVRLVHSERQDEGDVEVKKVCQHILDKFMGDVVERVASPDSPLQPDFLTSLMCDKRLDQKTLVAFASHHISLLLKHPPTGKTEEAFQSQHLWTFVKSPERLTGLIKQLFLVLSAPEVGRELCNSVQTVSVGWRFSLTLTSTFLLCYPEATALLKEAVRDLLTVSLENSQSSGLQAAFLLARQASLEGPHVFPSYSHWFQTTFGDSVKSPANNRKAFLFLVKFLTDLVPQESAEYLKAHILKPPFVPPKCKELLSDYLLLAKTRLADLKDPIDGSSADDTEGGQSVDVRKDQRLEEEVQKALGVFETSGKIPAFIIEASIFKKPYYIGRFLPVLLKPRTLPDKPDARMKLIEELKRAEKLPLSLYNNYKTACEQEKLQLLEGLGTDDDDMEDALLEPMDQLRFRLDQLIQTMDQKDVDQNSISAKVAEVLSHVAEKIGAVLDSDSCSVSPYGVGGDNKCCLRHPQIPRLHLQVVDCLLNAVCKMVACGEREPQTLGRTLLSVARMLSRHTSMFPSLLARLYQLITTEGYFLKSHHIVGLAALLMAMGSISSLWEPITVQDTKLSAKDVIEHLIGQLPFHTSQWMLFTLRFCTAYLKYALGCFPSCNTIQEGENSGFIPAALIKKFCYLCQRFAPGFATAEMSPMHFTSIEPPLSLDISQSVYNSTVFKDLLQSLQLDLTFAEWIEYELQINPLQDILSQTERCNYYLQMSHNHFLPRRVELSGRGLSYQGACSLILHALLRPSQTSDSSVCSQCQNDDSFTRILHRNREAIIGLLQNLSICLVNDDATLTSHDGGTQSWLLAAMESHINQCQKSDGAETGETSPKLRLQEFMSIATALQPSLLFSNTLSQVSVESVQAALTVISSDFKELLSEGCTLPFHVTAYCIVGLSSVLQRVVDKSIIAGLLHTCPILIASLMDHWSNLGNLVNVFLGVCEPEYSTDLQRLQKWALRSVDDGTIDQMDQQIPDWLCGVALFSAVKDRWNQPHLALWSQMANTRYQVVYVCAACLIHQLTWLQMYSQAEHVKGGNQKQLMKTIQDILTAQPIIIFDMCSQNLNSFVTENLVGASVSRLTFATLLRLMVKLSPAQLEGMFQQSSTDLVRGMLHLYVKAGDLYDTFEWGAGHNKPDPLKIEEFHQFRSCLLQLLSRMSPGQMRDLHVDQSILQICDPVIRGFVQ